MKMTRRFSSESQFITAITLLFSAAIGIGLWRHEMWRDEYHAWGLVLYSHSLSQMLSNLRGEGHLPFSYIIFYFLSRFTANPHAVQFAQFFTAIACAYLLLRFAPFKRWQKVLFLFGYFPLYEYGVISRSYTWNMLGLFGFCAVYSWAKEQNRNLWMASIFLLIMVFNEPFGILMALPLAGLLIWELCAKKQIAKSTWLWLSGIAAIAAALLVYALLRVITSSQWDSLRNHFFGMFNHPFKAEIRLLKAIILPRIRLPKDILDFSILHDQLLSSHNITGSVIAILLTAIVIYLFCRLILAAIRLPLNFWERPSIFIVWGTGTTLLILFAWIFIGRLDAPRHAGHSYLFFIACWWLYAYFPKQEISQRSWLTHVKKYAKSDFRFLLLAQLAFGLFAYCLDIVYPFSANLATATYLQKHHLQNAVLVTDEPIAIILRRPAYLPEQDIVSTTFTYGKPQKTNATRDQARQEWRQRIWYFIKTHARKNTVVLALKEPLNDARLQKYFLWRSAPGIVDDEQFTVYLIPRGALDARSK